MPELNDLKNIQFACKSFVLGSGAFNNRPTSRFFSYYQAYHISSIMSQKSMWYKFYLYINFLYELYEFSFFSEPVRVFFFICWIRCRWKSLKCMNIKESSKTFWVKCECIIFCKFNPKSLRFTVLARVHRIIKVQLSWWGWQYIRGGG